MQPQAQPQAPVASSSSYLFCSPSALLESMSLDLGHKDSGIGNGGSGSRVNNSIVDNTQWLVHVCPIHVRRVDCSTGCLDTACFADDTPDQNLSSQDKTRDRAPSRSPFHVLCLICQWSTFERRSPGDARLVERGVLARARSGINRGRRIAREKQKQTPASLIIVEEGGTRWVGGNESQGKPKQDERKEY